MTWWATRQVVDRLLADRTSAFRRLPGNKHRRFRVDDVLSLAEERDRRHRWNERHSLRITRACRSDVSTDPWTRSELCSGVSLRVFIEREGEGS